MSPSQVRTRVKICGITTREDAEAAIAAGADALGFNGWNGSKRYIPLSTIADWQIPPFVTRVALLVNAPLEEAQRVARLPFIDAVQLHGDENPAYCRRLMEVGRPVIKALRIRSEADLAGAGTYSTSFLLIDAHVDGYFGGTGVPVDLDLARALRDMYPAASVILAGGLRPENVAAAVRAVLPYAVDVSSGVESEPGRKDASQVEAFIRAVQGA